MNILIIGPTSAIGQSISSSFAKKNTLILVGRSKTKLEHLKKKLINKKAIKVKIVLYDLTGDSKVFFEKLNNIKVDLIINIASATSSIYDNNIKIKKLDDNCNVDLINPLIICKTLYEKNNYINIIYITSILSKIQTPNRIVYSSFKSLQSKYLEALNCKLLTVIIGTEIIKNSESKKSKKLAKKIKNAYMNNKKSIFFGLTGRLLWVLYYVNPLLVKLVILIKRKLIN